MSRFRRIAVAALAVSALTMMPGITAVSAAGQQSCLSGNICVAYQAAGSIIYGLTPSSSNLTSLIYSNQVFVDNNVGFGRTRNSSFVRVCFRSGLSFTGVTRINAPYSGATWVVDSSNTWDSSSYFATNFGC